MKLSRAQRWNGVIFVLMQKLDEKSLVDNVLTFYWNEISWAQSASQLASSRSKIHSMPESNMYIVHMCEGGRGGKVHFGDIFNQQPCMLLMQHLIETDCVLRHGTLRTWVRSELIDYPLKINCIDFHANQMMDFKLGPRAKTSCFRGAKTMMTTMSTTHCVFFNLVFALFANTFA